MREIARRTGLSRTTIRKYLNSDVVEPKYAARKVASKLDAFEDKLTRWLETEPGKRRKQRRNLWQMFADLVSHLGRVNEPYSGFPVGSLVD